ncbi:hypothetical protein [Fibrella forsythiae]|uniref:Uncharacterized protein n=1 Tax=Fibrella forsythiae TaxID=2817061 RepID=A0ABS3JBF2_9BACT|nr:hypothetical protein [Fibrella forsythiae]MBO0947313.1 hypothetical protein [Fibrella forsythiae]
MDTQTDNDLYYYHLPTVDPAEHYELGECIVRKDPSHAHPEWMILEVLSQQVYYLVQGLYGDGIVGPPKRLSIREAHFYYEKA